MITYCSEHLREKIFKQKFILENLKSDISNPNLPYQEQQEILGN